MDQVLPSFTQLIDLAAERLGGKVLWASDDFFAEKENLIKAGRGVFVPGKYTDRGKWMDGWESRRKRTPGHDKCIIKLGAPGKIHGFDIDTNHFLGNHPPFASIDGLFTEDNLKTYDWVLDDLVWTEILPKSPLEPGSHNYFEVNGLGPFSHLMLHIYPDGGVARLKAYGEVVWNLSESDSDILLDLAAAEHGGRVLDCNDMFFSSMHNLIMPGRGINMSDGWETKRSRISDNCDWVIIRLGKKGAIKRVVVDTAHFKGNYPDTCSLEGCILREDDSGELLSDGIEWKPILPKLKLGPDHDHYFEKEIINPGPFTHVRFNIYPDGGVSRLRLLGTVSEA